MINVNIPMINQKLVGINLLCDIYDVFPHRVRVLRTEFDESGKLLIRKVEGHPISFGHCGVVSGLVLHNTFFIRLAIKGTLVKVFKSPTLL